MWGYQAGWGMAMGIGMMLFWILVIVLAMWAVTRSSAAPQNNEARHILEERFASGEIDEGEFRKRASFLRVR